MRHGLRCTREIDWNFPSWFDRYDRTICIGGRQQKGPMSVEWFLATGSLHLALRYACVRI